MVISEYDFMDSSKTLTLFINTLGGLITVLTVVAETCISEKNQLP